MAAEIQVFVVAGEVNVSDQGITLVQAAQNEFFTNVFPAAVPLNFLIQIRKEAADAVPEIDLEIRVRNADGQVIHGPIAQHAEFGGDHRFGLVTGTMTPNFPAPGLYTIDARIITEGHVHEIRYDIDAYQADEPPV